MIPYEKGVDNKQPKNICGMCGKYFKQELEFILGASIWACASCFYKLQELNDKE